MNKIRVYAQAFYKAIQSPEATLSTASTTKKISLASVLIAVTVALSGFARAHYVCSLPVTQK
jgi:hypothetical protein